jgi:GrpB-like predicted nucleotidyltransferase (UPF0157 family)
MTNEVIVVEYDPSWPRRFEEEKARLLVVVGDQIEDIQHIGSTAVPGLGAKPIIDIQVSLRDLVLVQKCVGPLESIGYEYLGEYGVPGRHFFHKPARRPFSERTHHLQIVEKGGEQWRKVLLFRDYLRAHPEVSQQYHLLKKGLVSRFGADRDGYTEAKTAFVRSVLEKAEMETAIERDTAR